MHENIERNRQGCNLQGALQTINQIEGVIPILHSTPGCGVQNYYANKSNFQGDGFLSGYEIPNSNVFEKQVIFGGTSRLREQIKNSVKVFNGELFVVLSGCEAEMVGDDSLAMTQEIVDQGEKAIHYKAPGFAGNQYIGYTGAIRALLSELPDQISFPKQRTKGLVNIFGILPVQDIFWRGNLAEIERMLGNIGIRANTLFGYGQGIRQWDGISNAELNIVVSKWGIPAAKQLKEKYGTPYIVFEDIGVGEDTDKFIRAVAKALGTDQSLVEEYLQTEKSKFVYALEQFCGYLYDYDFQKTAAIIGDESTVIRYGQYLTKYWGMEIGLVIITDYTGSVENQYTPESLKLLTNEVYYSKDTSTISNILKAGNIELILGSGLENIVARQLKIPNYIISYPSIHKVVINRSDVGYTGAISILEELSNFLINN